jgi:ribosomal protein S12 methylthiotransferase
MNVQGKKVYLISLGCAKNLVDSEYILGLLKDRGFLIVSSLEKAEVAIINTCGFIQSAVEECVDTILEVTKKKDKGELEKILVTGCFVQRYGYKLQREIPEVDGWAGTGDISNILDLLDGKRNQAKSFFIGRPGFLADHTTSRVLATPFYSAYIKIAEGCSHKCSFCCIPILRGRFRSRGMDSIIIEAEGLVVKGVKEINLVAQDTSMYGRDLGMTACLEDLLEKLLLIKGLSWIRILYTNPSGITERLLEIIEGEEVVCPYLDLPFQHVNKKILKAMGRNMSGENPMELVNRIRSMKRDISIRTTLMVGFPGETTDIFQELYDFVEEAEIERLSAFIFSPEKGTQAARLTGVPKRNIAKKRLDAIMLLQAKIAKKRNREFIGKSVPVLIEGFSEETDLLLKGRISTMAPEVDGQVLINRGHGIVGDIVPVRIKDAYSYDLIGEII